MSKHSILKGILEGESESFTLWSKESSFCFSVDLLLKLSSAFRHAISSSFKLAPRLGTVILIFLPRFSESHSRNASTPSNRRGMMISCGINLSPPYSCPINSLTISSSSHVALLKGYSTISIIAPPLENRTTNSTNWASL